MCGLAAGTASSIAWWTVRGAVVRRRVSGTDHPAAVHEELTVAAAPRYAQRHPDWAVSGAVDQAVYQVLELVELLVELPAPAASG